MRKTSFHFCSIKKRKRQFDPVEQTTLQKRNTFLIRFKKIVGDACILALPALPQQYAHRKGNTVIRALQNNAAYFYKPP